MEVVNKAKFQKMCNDKARRFIRSKLRNFVVPHFYIIWKISKDPIVGRPIVAGYNINTGIHICGALFKRIQISLWKMQSFLLNNWYGNIKPSFQTRSLQWTFGHYFAKMFNQDI